MDTNHLKVVIIYEKNKKKISNLKKISAYKNNKF